MKKLPKTLYVAYEEEGTDNEYLSCSESYNTFAVTDEKRKVGVYQLVEVKTVVNKSELQ